MSMELLDKNGLAYFWGKIKSYVAGLLSSKADDSGVVHLAGDESVTGTKTFVGSKKIAFKQSTANDKLGFTLFNNSNVEKGYLEYNPTNQISGVPLMTLGNYATAAAGLTYVGFRKYSNISGAAGAYNLLTPLISDARVPFNLTTTYTNFFLPLGVTDGTTIVVTDKSGLLDISPLLVSVDSSDAITAMTGYSKPGSGGAITVNDSLNDAIGKLEFKIDSIDDSSYVHLTGDETIAGTKTFSSPISGDISGSSTKATQDSVGQQINTTYIKALSVSGTVITYTKGDDTTGTITTQDTTYSAATQSAAGLMSAADKKKLDGIATGADSIPVGTIIYYAKSTVPTNFLICNGGAVSRTTYATLFGVIGTTFGAGDSSTTFNVPNLIDKFPQGNATPGTVKAAGLPNITGDSGWVAAPGNKETTRVGAITKKYIQQNNLWGSGTSNVYSYLFDASKSNAIYGKSSTVQPPALTLVPCIRYA